jgi:hypothetical protein
MTLANSNINGKDNGNGSGNGNKGHRARVRKPKLLPPSRPAWEIMDGENDGSYALFKMYRDMNPLERTLKSVATISGRNLSSITTLSSDYGWMTRCHAWDYHIESARLELSEQYQLDMFKRHADLCVGLLDKVKARLEKLRPNTLKPRDVVQWIDIATKIERMSRGVANESVVANLTQINMRVENMSKLSDDDLEKIIAQEKRRKLRIGALDVKELDKPSEQPPPASTGNH